MSRVAARQRVRQPLQPENIFLDTEEWTLSGVNKRAHAKKQASDRTRPWMSLLGYNFNKLANVSSLRFSK